MVTKLLMILFSGHVSLFRVSIFPPRHNLIRYSCNRNNRAASDRNVSARRGDWALSESQELLRISL